MNNRHTQIGVIVLRGASVGYVYRPLARSSVIIFFQFEFKFNIHISLFFITVLSVVG
jgi:hypothetical protein